MEIKSIVNGQTIAYPSGLTQTKWFGNGYRAGMSDIQDIINRGGALEDIAQWVKDNG